LGYPRRNLMPLCPEFVETPMSFTPPLCKNCPQ
jgi:hypothetical protein